MEPLLAGSVHHAKDYFVKHALLVDVRLAGLFLQVANGFCNLVVLAYCERTERHVACAGGKGVEGQHVVGDAETVRKDCPPIPPIMLVEHFLEVAVGFDFLQFARCLIEAAQDIFAELLFAHPNHLFCIASLQEKQSDECYADN